MATQVTQLCGSDWEEWANKLLLCHYGPAEYQQVPDRDRGDAGIEGFTRTHGHAYQAYGCEEPIGTTQRYENQRRKMTDDVAKFINNRAHLARIFGPVRITRWVLFVPRFDSKQIVAHAATKTVEVTNACLPYVGDPFHVAVCHEGAFSVERDRLLNADVRALEIEMPTVSLTDVAEWSTAHRDLSTVLAGKLSRLATLHSESQRIELHREVLAWFLKGQEVLETLRDYPDLYAKAQRAKSHQEQLLARHKLSGDAPHEMFKAAINELQTFLASELRGLHTIPVDSLVYEAIADWLLRCPLDFPEVSNHGKC